MPNEINIQPIPPQIDFTDLNVKANNCYTNAYDLAQKNAGVTVVEGVLLVIDNDNGGKAAAHAWNELGGSHFDITATLWITDEHSDVKSLHYFPNVSHNSNELVHPDLFKFDVLTCKDVKELNVVIALQAANSNRSVGDKG